MSNSKMTLVLCAIGVFVLGAVVALGGEHLLFKQSDPRDGMQTMRAFQDWRLTCSARTEKSGGCAIQQTIVQRGSGNPLLELTVSQKGADEMLAVVTPLGVLVPPGIRFAVGSGQPRAAAFKTCMQGGCVATLPLDTALTTAMEQNTTGQIVVVTGEGKQVPLTYSLKGFQDAVAARAVDMKSRKAD